MKALITGGAGFIGSHLADELIKRGYIVCVVDNISTGNEGNIQHLKENKNFSFVKGSVLNKPLMNKLIQDADVVYHLAAAVGVKYIMENPLKSIHTNIYGT
ncbi:MAG: SDR family NAD(P)-dependent oxidoreductase, partial [Candidatus Poribacteria bacterium]